MFHQKKMIGKNLRKKLFLMFCISKKKKCILLMFQKIIQITKSYSLITSSGEKLWHDLALKKLSALLKGIT